MVYHAVMADTYNHGAIFVVAKKPKTISKA
jgi:hypothetical protein